MKIFLGEQLNPETIASSGQCFRMRLLEDGGFLVVAGQRAVRLVPEPSGGFRLHCGKKSFEGYWRRYFDLDTDYDAALRRIAPEETYLRRAAESAAGLRMLRQEPFETLISFILSQRKSIPAIRGCVEALCSRYGREIPGAGVRGFPSARRLARASEAELRACGLGYRAPYVKKTAEMVARGQVDLTACDAMTDEALLQTLLTFPGVGVKVANCVMLFAYHRLQAAPVDVWIQKVIEESYGGLPPFERWGADAGLYQQYLFYYRQHVIGRQGGSEQLLPDFF